MVDPRWQKHGFYGAAALAALLLALALPGLNGARKKVPAPVSVSVVKETQSLVTAASPSSVIQQPSSPLSVPQSPPPSAATSPAQSPPAPSAVPANAARTLESGGTPVRRDGPPVTPAPRLPVEAASMPPPAVAADNSKAQIPAPLSPNAPGLPSVPGTPIGESAGSGGHATTAGNGLIDVPVADTGSGSSAQAVHLADAPQADLLEKGPDGALLPVIGKQGRQSWFVYARPFMGASGRPKIAIAIAGLGLEKLMTEAVITEIPPDVSLIFDPYSPDLGDWVARARGEGHEVFLSVPMEPFAYPRDDPGPYTLLTQLSRDENIVRLDWVLSRASGYVGLTTLSGTEFTTDENSLLPIFKVIGQRGLAWLDSGIVTHDPSAALAKKSGLPSAGVRVRLDATLTPAAIDAAFGVLLDEARHSGGAIGIAWQPTPLLIEELQKLLPSLRAQGVDIAPVSALLDVPARAK